MFNSFVLQFMNITFLTIDNCNLDKNWLRLDFKLTCRANETSVLSEIMSRCEFGLSYPSFRESCWRKKSLKFPCSQYSTMTYNGPPKITSKALVSFRFRGLNAFVYKPYNPTFIIFTLRAYWKQVDNVHVTSYHFHHVHLRDKINHILIRMSLF